MTTYQQVGDSRNQKPTHAGLGGAVGALFSFSVGSLAAASCAGAVFKRLAALTCSCASNFRLASCWPFSACVLAVLYFGTSYKCVSWMGHQSFLAFRLIAASCKGLFL